MSHNGILNTDKIHIIYGRKLCILIKKSAKYADSDCTLERTILKKGNFFMMLQNSEYFPETEKLRIQYCTHLAVV